MIPEEEVVMQVQMQEQEEVAVVEGQPKAPAPHQFPDPFAMHPF